MNNDSFFMAHGAGTGHDSDFLKSFGAAFCRSEKLQYVPVTFKYMKDIRSTGKRRPPPKFTSLVEEYLELVCKVQKGNLNIIAGKSLGGRLATQLSAESFVSGIVCFGFPFYQQGKPEKHRLSFLEKLEKPCLIFQGTRDAFGRPECVNKQELPDCVTIHWIEGADHDFELLKSQKKTCEQTIEEMVYILNQWIKKTVV